AVETVAPRQHPDAGPLVELQDRERKLIEHVLVDLKELIAGIAFEHIDQRLAGMAVGIEAGAREHGLDLAPEIGSGARRTIIRSRGEQTDDAHFADQPALPIELLDADV